METSSGQLANFRPAGIALLAVVVLFMIGAFSAAYFRKMPLPTDPLEQLTRIADDRIGWTAQAIIFPMVLTVSSRYSGVGARYIVPLRLVLPRLLRRCY
jgi:hypothetical protein